MSEMDYWEIEEDIVDARADELTDIEKLAVAQAFYNAVGELVNTKSGSLRLAANDFYRTAYETTGGKSYEVRLMGVKVGTYTITTSKPKPSKSTRHVVVDNMADFDEWADQHGFTAVSYDMDGVNDYFAKTGEVPPGCRVEEIVTPAEDGGRITRTTFKVDNEAVIEALDRRIGTVATMLLEGAE